MIRLKPASGSRTGRVHGSAPSVLLPVVRLKSVGNVSLTETKSGHNMHQLNFCEKFS